jgi:hypothetical protein
MKIALLPLDERPVNTRYPRQIAAIAGVELRLPPAHALPKQRTSGDIAALAVWLQTQAATCDVLLVSLDLLGYGGLIPSRTSDEAATTILARLAVLRTIKQAYPRLPIYAFNVITRISNADNNIEEPPYWDTYGTRLYRYSQLMHQVQHATNVQPALDELEAAIPPTYRADFTRRRLRNHLVNLHALELLAAKVFDLLVLSSDDTSEYGFGSQEKAWLQTWAQRLQFPAERLLMYPGADEIGCVLLMRAILAHQHRTPKIYVRYAIPADQQIIAPYEDSPIAVTVERQIRALGGEIVPQMSEATLILAVNTPTQLRREYAAHDPALPAEQARRQADLTAFAHEIDIWLKDQRRVMVADVAYPNGSDPDLIRHLLPLPIAQLAAYGAWNTAGNTLGTVVAQGAATLLMTTEAQRTAQTAFLLHRFIEDWGYQHLVRQQVRNWLEATSGLRDTTPTTQAAALAQIEAQLTVLLSQLGALSAHWHIRNLRLPWQRTFEVDFDLERH